MKTKVVVTGIGAISPIGNSVEEFCTSLKNGKSGIGPTTLFDTTDFDVKIAGEVKNFDPTLWIDKKELRKMARFTQFAAAASAQALLEAGLLGEPDAEGRRLVKSVPEKTGIVLGNGIGGFEIITEAFKKLLNAGPKRMPPLTVPMMIGNEAAGNISMLFGTKGPAFTQVTACASAIPVSKNLCGILRKNGFNPDPSGIAGLIATTRESCFASARRFLPNIIE